MRNPIIALAASLVLAAGAAPSPAQTTTPRDADVPHYDHIFVLLEENKGTSTIIGSANAPQITNLAKAYGSATQMFAETHPSEPNYVAMLGGDTFGIKDDDGWFCTPGSTRTGCTHASEPDYVAHLVDGPNLASQLHDKGLAWRAYLEDIPAPGSLEMISPATDTAPAALYAAKHTGFTNFASVHKDPNLVEELVGFDRLHADLKAGNVPAFALVVPNQCNEMHGIGGEKAPADCGKSGKGPLIARGDAYAGKLIAEIQASPVWTKGNTAIILTWDEDGGEDRVNGASKSCCVTDAHNPGGGHIPTIVITNHGPRGVTDPTQYNHYSVLRTIEDALGLDGHIRHAADVAPMAPLFGPLR